jgi:predicted NBD/HSP70 family sugar kinase
MQLTICSLVAMARSQVWLATTSPKRLAKDPIAIAGFTTTAQWLGAGIASLSVLFDPPV